MTCTLTLRPLACLTPFCLALIVSGCAFGRDDFDPKHDGRGLRIATSFPLTPFVYGWMGFHILTESRGPHDAKFEEAVIYRPEGSVASASDSVLTEEDMRLLEKFAPVLVQEIPDAPRYDPRADMAGRPLPLAHLDGRKYVYVDTDRPTMHAAIGEAKLAGRPHRQLLYVYWFPKHPKKGRGLDPEAGAIEGLTLRITLDSKGDRPCFYETVYNCGCYHRIYPAQWVEERARAQFGEPHDGEYTSVRKAVSRKIDFYAPEAVAEGSGDRLVIFSAARNHYPLRLGRESELAARAPKARSRSLELRDYAELETGGPDGRGIFDRDQLVTGADRPEAFMLYPTGIYHAGTPRRRGTQLIHFDQYDFDAPDLIEQGLHVPEGI